MTRATFERFGFRPRLPAWRGRWEVSAPELRAARYHKLRVEFQAVHGPAAPDGDDADGTAACYDRLRRTLADEGRRDAPDWPALFDADVCLLRLLSGPSLAAKAERLRIDHADAAGRARPAADPALPPGCDERVVRAQAIELLSEIGRLRITRHAFTRMRNRLVAAVTGMVLVAVLTLTLMADPVAGRSSSAAALVTVAVVGMLGGSISSVSRVFALTWSAELAGSIDDLRATYRGLLLNVCASVLQGAVFALAAYALFAAGLLQGSLFPRFRDSSDPLVRDQTLAFFERGPASHPDFAKALVWSFVAGFSERLVPDFLRNLRLSAGPPGA